MPQKKYDNNRLSGKIINDQLDEIQRLYSDGRSMKTQNFWNAEWEQGTKNLATACKKARDLRTELQERCSELRHLMVADLKKQKRNTQSILAFGVGVVVSALLFLLLK